MNKGMKKYLCINVSILVIRPKKKNTFCHGTFYTFGHQAVLPAYSGVGGIAPWLVALPSWTAAVVLSILQLWDDVYRQPVRMRILTGRVRIMNFVGV